VKRKSLKKYEVDTPHYVAKLVVVDGVVSKAAPILAWTIGRKWDEILLWSQQHNFKVHLCR
jgi:hypothetical protein